MGQPWAQTKHTVGRATALTPPSAHWNRPCLATIWACRSPRSPCPEAVLELRPVVGPNDPHERLSVARRSWASSSIGLVCATSSRRVCPTCLFPCFPGHIRASVLRVAHYAFHYVGQARQLIVYLSRSSIIMWRLLISHSSPTLFSIDHVALQSSPSSRMPHLNIPPSIIRMYPP